MTATGSSPQEWKSSEPTVPVEVPVLIVGAGPTGLLAANLLGTYGVPCLIVERNATTSDHPKAILLDDEGLRALQACGLAERVEQHVISGHGARYYAPDGTCFARVDAPITEHGYPRRNSFLQPDLERILLDGLSRFAHINIIFTHKFHRFTEINSSLVSDIESCNGTLHVTSEYLLACDGARSSVRQQLGISMVGRTDDRDWVVVDTVNDPDQDKFSKFLCDPSRPMVSIPAPGGGRRYEFMVLPGEDGGELARKARIREILGRFRPIPDREMTRAAVYTFQARVADSFGSDRIWVLGDAAHLTPPFAGQGMNAGLRDAFNMSWKIAAVLAGASGEDLLATYERERRTNVEEMIDYAVSLGEVVMPQSRFDDTTREQIVEALKVGDDRSFRAKPQAAYSDGYLVSGLGHRQEHVGRPLPQPTVVRANGDKVKLDDALGAGFSLVGCGERVMPQLKKLKSQLDGRWQPTAVLIVPDNPPPARHDGIETVSLAERSPVSPPELEDQLLLVRPDRFVAAQIDINQLDFAAQALDRLP